MLRLHSRPIGSSSPASPPRPSSLRSDPAGFHEIKHDGYRLMGLQTSERMRLLTRSRTASALLKRAEVEGPAGPQAGPPEGPRKPSWTRPRLMPTFQVGEGTLGRHGHPPPNGGLADFDAELEQFPMDAGRRHNGLALLMRRIKPGAALNARNNPRQGQSRDNRRKIRQAGRT
jgi:hypothetical protein